MTALAVSAVLPYRGQLLLVRRDSTPPTWAFPGGHVRYREPLRDAIQREVLEETHLLCAPVAVITELEIRTPEASYALFVFACRMMSLRTPSPGDDASETRWIPKCDLSYVSLAPGMRSTLTNCALS